MKNKKNILIFVIFIFFINVSIVNATYDCSYKISFKSGHISGKRDYSFTITIDENSKTLKFGNLNYGFFSRQGSISELDSLLISQDEDLSKTSNELLEQRDKLLFDGKCDSTLLVFWYYSSGAGHEYIKILFDDTLEANAKKYMNGNFTSGTYLGLQSDLAIPDPDNSSAEFKDKTYTCITYKTLYDNIKTASESIKSCKNNCSVYYSNYNKLKEDIKSFCDIQYQYLDYGKSCLNVCLEYSEEIKKLGVENYDNGECGESGNLIKWIKNILKWVKYILPVLVIILGIIDFIKAIASGSDDEMKKAQGRFIKRLIAAALLFLVPALIEFILNVFNIESTFCGLTD